MTRLYLLLLAAALAVFGVLALAGVAHGAEGDPHQVLVCKYVGTPGDGETLQTGQNPIVVDTHALEGDGFAGVFPFEFSDAQGRSVAIRYLAEGESPGDQFSIAECEGGSPSPTPTPTPTQSPSESLSPTPLPTTPPPTTTSPSPPSSGTHTPTSGKSTTHTPSKPPASVRRTAFTGTSLALKLSLLTFLLLCVGSLALRVATHGKSAR